MPTRLFQKDYTFVLVAFLILLLLSNFLSFNYASRTSFNRLQSNIPWHGSLTPVKDLSQPDSPSQQQTSAESRLVPNVKLPEEYRGNSNTESAWCQDRYSTKYLLDLVGNRQQYCDPDTSSGSLICHHTSTSGDGASDSFCLSSATDFHENDGKFVLDCKTKEAVQPSLSTFPEYWYGTGPRALLDRYMTLSSDKNVPFVSSERNFSILVKRENPVDNLWHVLMQIESVLLSLDVLSTTVDDNGIPLYTPEDVNNTKVVITDELEDSTLDPLWQMITPNPVQRLSNPAHRKALQHEHIILPLAGKSNPMWQGDWSPHMCSRSELLRVFSSRLLKFHGLEAGAPKTDDKPLVLTWIDRHGQRQLIDKARHLERIKC